ncbi:MAG: hypothetical protein ACK47B_01185 [Armatimonadota bacterium]
MRRAWLVGLLSGGLLLAGGAGPASAQSLYGPGGLFLHPAAQPPPEGQLTPAILVLPQHNPAARSTRTWISGSLDYGLTPRLELTATYLKVAGWQRDASLGGSLKYLLQEETGGRPALAVGFTQLGGGDVNARLGFLAAKKSVGRAGRMPLTLHAGVQYVDELDGLSRHEFQPFAGFELGISSRLTFIAEGRPRMNAEFGTPLALTLSYRASRSWHLAISWANNGLSDEPRFGIGAGLALGTRK